MMNEGKEKLSQNPGTVTRLSKVSQISLGCSGVSGELIGLNLKAHIKGFILLENTQISHAKGAGELRAV